jgi:hypothetical protein
MQLFCPTFYFFFSPSLAFSPRVLEMNFSLPMHLKANLVNELKGMEGDV